MASYTVFAIFYRLFFAKTLQIVLFYFLVFVENFVENVKKPPFLTLFDGAKSGQIPVFPQFQQFFPYNPLNGLYENATNFLQILRF